MILAALALAQATSVAPPIPTLKWQGWQVPGVADTHRRFLPRSAVKDAFDTWTVRRGKQRILAWEIRGGPEEPFWASLAFREPEGIRLQEEIAIPDLITAYALPGQKPYCYRITATLLKLNGPIGDTVSYAIYDHDGDGVFEQLEATAQVTFKMKKLWVPGARLGKEPPAIAGSPEPMFRPLVSEEGWYVLGRREFETSTEVEDLWSLAVGDLSVRAERIALHGYDDAWITAGSETKRGILVSHERSFHGGKGVRYFTPEGRLFCVRVSVHPWVSDGMLAAEWEWVAYDLDGDGRFEILESGGVMNKEAERRWVPRLPTR